MSNADATNDLLTNLARLDLPALTSEQAPQFTTLVACKQWLAGIAITNAPLAQAQLLRQLDLLNRYALPAEERLQIVEYLRSPCYFVHGECAKRFAAQRPALPLGTVEQAAFDASQALWRTLETGFLHCLQSLLDKSASAPLGAEDCERAALAATRALTTALASYLDHCGVGLVASGDFWNRLHKIHFIAERLEAAQLPVADKLSHATGMTAQATYVEALLLAAAHPHELRPKQFVDVVYWAHRWATKAPLLRTPPEDLRTPPLCVDLARGAPGEYSAPRAAATLRWLDLGELRKTIKQRLVKLGEGVSPQELKLGKFCVQPACELLLRQVYQDWCKGGRGSSDGGGKDYELLAGVDAIHFHLSGQLFRSPEASVYLSKRAHEEIATFGHIATRFEEDKKQQSSYVVEGWRSVEESVVNIQLERPLGQPGGALTLDQLVGVRHKDDVGFQLGKITWLCLDIGAAVLRAGIHLLPGAPTAVTVQNPGSGTAKSQYARGFCLPAIEGLNQLATVLTPAGWFRANHVIEIRTDRNQPVRLTRLLERGADYDRCAFETL